MRKTWLFLIIIIAYLYCVSTGSKNFNLFNTYGDYMVLQHGTSVAINGISLYLSDTVKVTLSTMQDKNTILQTKSTNVVTNSQWQIYFDPVNASFTEYYIEAASSNNISDIISLSHVLFGDVYICSGQSNMGISVYQAFNESQSCQEANNYPNIRLFWPLHEASATQQTQLIAIHMPWSITSNHTVVNFSAVCFFYGKNLYDKLNYPIGLIQSCYPGTPIRGWMSTDALSKCPNEQKICDTDTHEKLTPSPPQNCSVLWNANISPLTTMTIRGAVWYQGEDDTNTNAASEAYFCAFKEMIFDWRMKWNLNSKTDKLFPFGAVQISVWNDENNQTCGSSITWNQCIGAAQVRWAQTGNKGYVPNTDLPNVFIAISTDLGDPSSPYTDIHPRYKQQVAKRLSDGGLNMIYGYKNIYWLGPVVNNITCNKNIVNGTCDILIVFDNVNEDGILMKNPTGFEYFRDVMNEWIYIDDDIFSLTEDGKGIQFTVNGTDISQLRYDFYHAPCLPEVGIYNCAIYDKSELLPLGLFISSVSCD